MKLKELIAELQKWDDNSDVMLYSDANVDGIGIYPPDTMTRPEHVIEIPS